jgi:hypothetical protein
MPGLLGLTPFVGSQQGGGLLGLAPYGFRYEESPSAPFSVKGHGYFGLLPTTSGGVSTEISAHDDKGFGFPLLNPLLDSSEMNLLLSGARPTPAMYEKAQRYAQQRTSNGLGPFASPIGLKFPVP